MKKWIALLIVVVILLTFGAFLEQSKNVIYAWTVRDVIVMYGTETLDLEGSDVRDAAKVLKKIRGEESDAAQSYATMSYVEQPVATFNCKTFFGEKLITVHGQKYLIDGASCLELTDQEQASLKELLQKLFPEK